MELMFTYDMAVPSPKSTVKLVVELRPFERKNKKLSVQVELQMFVSVLADI